MRKNSFFLTIVAIAFLLTLPSACATNCDYKGVRGIDSESEKSPFEDDIDLTSANERLKNKGFAEVKYNAYGSDREILVNTKAKDGYFYIILTESNAGGTTKYKISSSHGFIGCATRDSEIIELARATLDKLPLKKYIKEDLKKKVSVSKSTPKQADHRLMKIF